VETNGRCRDRQRSVVWFRGGHFFLFPVPAVPDFLFPFVQFNLAKLAEGVAFPFAFVNNVAEGAYEYDADEPIEERSFLLSN
jgi:hypothetical protein